MVIDNKNIQVGMKVVRGPHWEYGDQDIIKGNIGTIIHVSPDRCSATVRWMHKENVSKYTYRTNGRHFDLQLAPKANDKYPEFYNLGIGAKILINDAQGHEELKPAVEYELVEKHEDNSVTLSDGENRYRWFCNNNSSGKYFQISSEGKVAPKNVGNLHTFLDLPI